MSFEEQQRSVEAGLLRERAWLDSPRARSKPMRTKRVEVKIRGRMLVAKWVDQCPSDETGRRAGFKIQWGQPRVGSTPTSGTITPLLPTLPPPKP